MHLTNFSLVLLLNPIYYINSLRLSMTRQFYCKSILRQKRPLHFLWQNRPLYNFGAAGHGGGETLVSHRSRRHHCLLIPLEMSVSQSLSYFNLL